MRNTPTPGQVCYEAYQAAYECYVWTLPWTQLQPHFRQVWEAAAQAVLAWSRPPAILDLYEAMGEVDVQQKEEQSRG
jgi:hypothetical protein